MKLAKKYAIGVMANNKRQWVKFLPCGGIDLVAECTSDCWCELSDARRWSAKADPRYTIYEISMEATKVA